MHIITIECDSCGHQEHFTDRYTDANDAAAFLIDNELWQGITYNHPEEVVEIRCPNCHIIPAKHQSPEDIIAGDLLKEIAHFARYSSTVSVGYDLVDRLYALHEQKEAPSAAD